MAGQVPINDPNAQNKSLLAADSTTDSETRRIHTKTVNAKNYLLVSGDSAAPSAVSIINSDATDNSYTSGGVYGQKVHVVGDSDKHVRGVIAANSSLTGIEPVPVGFKDNSGNSQFALGDTTNGWWVNVKTGSVTSVPSLATTPVFGQARCTTAGTRVQLTSGTLTNGVIVAALPTNTGTITVGDSTVTNTVNGTGNGVVLVAGQATSFAIDNVNRLYINATANNDGVSWAGS